MWTPPRVVLKPTPQRLPRRLSAHLGVPDEALPYLSGQTPLSYSKSELQGTRMRCESVTRAQRHPVVNKESAGHASLTGHGAQRPLLAELLCLLNWKAKVAQSSRTLCDPMDYTVHGILLARNTRVGCLSLLQGMFPTQGSNPSLPHCSRILYQLSH